MIKNKVRKIPSFFLLFFAALGLIVAVDGIILNDWEGVTWGAFSAVSLFPDLFLIKHLRIRILHRFSVVAVVAVGCYVSAGLLLRIIMVIAGVVALLDAIHLIIRRRSLGESNAV